MVQCEKQVVRRWVWSLLSVTLQVPVYVIAHLIASSEKVFEVFLFSEVPCNYGTKIQLSSNVDDCGFCIENS